MSSNVDVPRKTVSASRPWWLDLLLARGPRPGRSSLARMAMLLVILAAFGPERRDVRFGLQ